MTPEQQAIIQTSFAKIAPVADLAATLFYGDLCERDPQLRSLFKEDMTEQRQNILVDILDLPIANCVEPANMSDRRAGGRLLAGFALLWPTVCSVIADAGHESRKLARQLQCDGWDLQIVRRKQRAFEVADLAWIVECSFAWLGFNRRLSREYDCQTPETLLNITAIRLMLNCIATGGTFDTVSNETECRLADSSLEERL